MSGAVRTRVRDAVIALLKDVSPGIPVRAYRGELGAKEEDAMRVLDGMAPGILVSVEAGAYRGDQVQRRKYKRDLAIVLHLVSTLQSTREDRDDELADLQDAILSRLIGAKPDIDGAVPIGHLKPVSDQVEVHTPEVCIWTMTWQITVEAALAEAPAPNVTESLASLNAVEDDDNAGDPIVQASTLFT